MKRINPTAAVYLRFAFLSFIFLLLFDSGFSQQRIQVKGRVTDENDRPLSGATIKVQNANASVIANEKGEFELRDLNGSEKLVVSYSGYTELQVNVNNQSSLTIRLQSKAQNMDEVVVIGYDTRRRGEVTSAISTVKSAQLTQTPIANVAQGLQGQVAGLQVTQANAAPGGAISMRLRGTNSIQGSSEPLYIIDGVQVQNVSQNIPVTGSNGRVSIGGNANEISPLSNLNPNDIESVEVLKDASAAAIYGSQAANGVVIITTKRGKNGRTRVEYDGYYGTQQITKTLKVMNGSQFAALENEVYNNPNRIPNPQSIGEGTDWQSLIFRKAPIQNHQVTVSGGNEKTQVLFSLNYFDQKGVIVNSSFSRYSFRMNLDHQATRWLKIGSSTLLTQSVNHRIPTGLIDFTNGEGLLYSLVGSALSTPPVLKPYDSAGGIYQFDRQFGGIYNEMRHPLLFTKTLDRQNTYTIVPNVYFDFTLLKNLKYRASFNAYITSGLVDYYMPISAFSISDLQNNGGGGGFAMKQNQNYNRLQHESVVNWDKTVGNGHNLRFTGLYSFIVNNNNWNFMTARRFASDATSNESMGLGQDQQARSGRAQDELLSYGTRLAYNYKRRYFLDLTGRVDGASKFGENNKYAFFPAASLAWNIANEGFFARKTLFSDLKLRAGIGRTGNQAAVGPYQSLATIGLGSDYVLNNLYVQGTQPTRVANPDLRWERSTQTNIGLDAGLWNNRLLLTVDAYTKKTDDLIFNRNLPLSSGYSSITGNFASLENRGLEFTVQGTPVSGKNFQAFLSANIAFNQNKITRLQDNLQSFDVNFYNTLIVGQPIGMLKTFVFDGIYQTGDTLITGSGSRIGGVRVKDISGPKGEPDGRITNDDQITTSTIPAFIYGFSTRFTYKNLELSTLFSGVQGSKLLNIARYQLENPQGMRNVVGEMANRWTVTNPSREFIHAGTNLGQRLPLTDRYIENGSFLRCKNITLAYRFAPKKYFNNIRVYASANNLFTITDYTGFDPEVNSFGGSNTLVGVDNIVYPLSRSFLFGVQFGL